MARQRNRKGQFAGKRSVAATRYHKKKRFKRAFKRASIRGSIGVAIGGGYYLVKAISNKKRAIIRAKIVTPKRLSA